MDNAKLENAREEIRKVDAEIAELFLRRMRAARDVADYKKERGIPILDTAQEERVIKRNSALVKDDELKPYYVEFLENTMAVSRRYQRRLMEGQRIAYSGVKGAFAHIAAKKIFPDSTLFSYPSFEAAYEAVEIGECDCAVLPIENSYEGEVGQVSDIMFNGSLHVNGVYNMPVTQNLLALEGASITDINTVVSHPQALGQCRSYIIEHGFEEISATNTAVAASNVAKAGDIHTAAIASAETADLYGLKILDHDINDGRTNTTRFAVFSKAEAKRPGGRDGAFILLFTVENTAGSLAKAIEVIGEYGFNMKVIRSRPMKDLLWQYYFYVELEGDVESDNAVRMLEALGKQCDELKIVGHYKDQK